MTKLKKLLLTLAPISAVMIATPIILTSCSTNSETQNNGGGSGNGNGGAGGDTGTGGGGNTGGGSGNGGSNENGGNTTNPNLTADNTNSKDFKPTTKDGLFPTIETTIKGGAPGKESEQMENAISGYNTLKVEDIRDAIDVWSFNKWVGVKNDKVKYTSSIDKYVANKKDSKAKTTWDISFTYKFKVITTYDSKTEDIYAERSFEVKDVDLATSKGIVDFTTKASLFMVDGKNMLEESPKLYDSKADASETESVKQVKAFLNSEKSNFNIRKIADEFVKNKDIKGEKVTPTPTWQAKKEDPMATVSNNVMTVNLTKNWTGNIKKDATKDAITKQLADAGTKKFILTYVKDGDGWTAEFDAGVLDTNKKTLTYKMTLKKTGETDVILDLVFTPVTK